MFGYTSSAAAVRNVFLVGNGSNTVAYVNAQGDNSASGSASRVSMGVLVGYNRGTVSNCSVSGYTMEYYGYSASTASLGGFVGSNYGTIRNSASDCPSIRFANTNSNTYAGGFAGVNHASISDSYALGSVQVRGARNSTVWVAGFAANNASGMIRRSYSATALTASGDAESYGFAHTGGSAYQCYYLDGGTYSYRGTLYAYNTSKNEFKDNAAGEPLRAASCKTKQSTISKRQITPIMPKKRPAIISTRQSCAMQQARPCITAIGPCRRISVRSVCSTGNMKTAAATAATTSATWHKPGQ